MLGRRGDWLRWLLAVALAVGVVRLGLFLVLPGLPPPFAWTGSVMLGLALVFLLLPFPHEALLAYRSRPEQRLDRSADE